MRIFTHRPILYPQSQVELGDDFYVCRVDDIVLDDELANYEDLAKRGWLGGNFEAWMLYDWDDKKVWAAILVISEAVRFGEVEEAIVELATEGQRPLIPWDTWRADLLTNWSGVYDKRLAIPADESNPSGER